MEIWIEIFPLGGQIPELYRATREAKAAQAVEARRQPNPTELPAQIKPNRSTVTDRLTYNKTVSNQSYALLSNTCMHLDVHAYLRHAVMQIHNTAL